MSRHIKLLGTLAIEEDGRPSRIMNSDRGIALAAYLIYTADIQSREYVADLLWEASSTRQSLTRLKELLYRVRKWLPGIKATRRTVTYQPADDDVIDLLALRDGLAADDVASLDEALRLYAGGFLEQFYLPEAAYFNEWLVIARERLHSEVSAAYRKLCQTYTEEGEWNEGIEAARRWLELEPLDEEAHRWLIQTLAGSGQATAALAAYETCRQILQDELGLEPEPATNQLAMKIMTRNETAFLDILEPLPTDELPEPGLLPPNTQLPFLRNADFVGRGATLLSIATLLRESAADGRPPVVAVTGMGGMGKTQTAVEFCYRYGRYFLGGVFWLSFAEADNVAGEMAAIGTERGLSLFTEAESLSLADQVGRVQKALQEPIPRLLIFDNCEDEGLLAHWLPVTGGCRTVVTSRRGVWSRALGVSAVPLDPLPLAESSLLVQRLAPQLLQEEAEEIAQAVGRLPLALHLAGSFLHHYKQVSAADYLFQMRDKGLLKHPSLRGRGASRSPTGHEQHVTRTFALSLVQLDPDDETDQMACRLLIHAACFAPGEPLPQKLLVETAADGSFESDLIVEDGLVRLADLGFLKAEKETITLHRLLAAFVVDNMADDTTLVKARTQVENTLLSHFHFVDPKEGSVYLYKYWPSPIPKSHLGYVTEMAVSGGSKSAALLLMALGNDLRTRGDYAEAQNYLERGLALAEAQEDIFTQGRIMSLLARVCFEQGFYQQTQQSALEAERLLRLVDAPDKGWLLIALERQAMSHLRLGQAKQALAVGEAARQLAPLTGNKDALAQILNLLGSTHYFLMGEYEIADNYFEEAIVLHRENGNRSSEAIILLNQADNAMTMGNFQRAEAQVQKALEIIRETGDKIKELSICVTKSEIQVHLGNYETAVDILTSVFSEAPKDWTYAGIANIVLAQGYLGMGEAAGALEIIRSSALVQSDDPFDSGEAWRILGRVAVQLGQPVASDPADDRQYSAAYCFGRSLQVFTEIDNKRERAITLWHWAAYELETGDEAVGKKMWEEAKAVFRGLNLPLFIARMENQ